MFWINLFKKLFCHSRSDKCRKKYDICLVISVCGKKIACYLFFIVKFPRTQIIPLILLCELKTCTIFKVLDSG